MLIMNRFLQDVRHALRRMQKGPGFTTVAVLSLSLGIGAGTAVFSLVNAILLRSLPVPNPQELRVLRWTGNEVRMTSLNELPQVQGNRTIAHSVTHPMFLNLRGQAAAQADIFGFQPLRDITARTKGEAFTARGMMVSDNFFSGLEVRPFVGRLLNANEDFAGSATSVEISYDCWEKHFALDANVVGQTVVLNGTGFTIVGVLPRAFSGVVPGDPSEFYVPMAAQSQFLYRPITESFHWFVRLMARLRPGVSDAQLRATLDVVFSRDASAIMKEPRILVEPGHGGLSIDRNNYRKPLMLMLAAVGLVLLVACANLAGLSLARGAARQHELSVRAALGVSRWGLIRQSLTENLVLALLGGGFGIFLAIWGKAAISRLLAGSADGLHYDLALDLTVLSFSLAIVLVTALLSGLLPALRAGHADPLAGLKSRSSLGVPRLRTGRVLVVAQICLSLLLLTAAGLYVRTLINLTHVDAGFSPEKLLLFELSPSGGGYDDGARRIAFYEQVQSSLAALPGVRGATLLETPMLANQDSWGGFVLDHFSPSAEHMQTHRLTVSETFFPTMGIPILDGRGLSRGDTADSYKVLVVNQTFVRLYSPDKNPLGRTVGIWGADWKIVGVCRDAKYSNIKEVVPPMIYFPFRQRLYGNFRRTHLTNVYFALRTTLPPLTLATTARKAVAAVDANVPLANITTQDAVLDTSISQERLFATLCGLLAGLALLLSCIGLYGLMAYHVTRRTGEIAVRMALGATRKNIASPILREALLLAVFGIAIGLPVALGLTRFTKSQLYGVAATDPVTLISAAGLLIAVVIVAALIPARRAAKVDPMVALRYE